MKILQKLTIQQLRNRQRRYDQLWYSPNTKIKDERWKLTITKADEIEKEIIDRKNSYEQFH